MLYILLCTNKQQFIELMLSIFKTLEHIQETFNKTNLGSCNITCQIYGHQMLEINIEISVAVKVLGKLSLYRWSW